MSVMVYEIKYFTIWKYQFKYSSSWKISDCGWYGAGAGKVEESKKLKVIIPVARNKKRINIHQVKII